MCVLSDEGGCVVVMGALPTRSRVAQSGRQFLITSQHGKSPNMENLLPSPKMSVWQDPQGTQERVPGGAGISRQLCPCLVTNMYEMGLALPHVQRK